MNAAGLPGGMVGGQARFVIVSGTRLCLCLVVASLVAARAAPTIVFKLDDLLDAPYSRDGFAAAARVLEANDAKASFGVILESCVDDGRKAGYYAQLKSWAASGRFELWHHGWDHSRREFLGVPVERQRERLRRGIQVLRDTVGVTPHAFGAPFGEVDAATVQALNATPEMDVWFASPTAGAVRPMVLSERAAMEAKTGVVSFELFVRNFRAKPEARYLVVLGHPPYWNDASRAAFARVVEFCRAQGCAFATASEMAALLRATAKP